MMVIQLLLVLLCLYIGARYGGLALGAMSGIGLFFLIFIFRMKPGVPPTDVIYIIIAAITCAGMMHAAGGMDWLIQKAEILFRKHPRQITILAPFSTFLLTVLVGTGQVVYVLMPIIYDIAIKNGIRPERPCAVASVASQIGITCSPIAAAVVAFVTISNEYGFHVTIPDVLLVSVPSCIIGLMCAAFYSLKRGKDLADDKKFQKKISTPEGKEQVYGGSSSTLGTKLPASAKRSVMIFLTAVALIILAAVFQKALPSYTKIAGVESSGGGVFVNGVSLSNFEVAKINKVIPGLTETRDYRLTMNIVIQVIMLVAASVMIVACKVSPKKAVAGTVWQSGMTAVVAIYGIAWMADTFVQNYYTTIEQGLGGFISTYPWAICLVFFIISILVNSQGAVVVTMLPLAYSLGVPGPILLGAFPCVYGYFFIPCYPSDIATVNFDRSGTTRIGKYLLNHSFMIPGLISIFVSTILSNLLVTIIY